MKHHAQRLYEDQPLHGHCALVVIERIVAKCMNYHLFHMQLGLMIYSRAVWGSHFNQRRKIFIY